MHEPKKDSCITIIILGFFYMEFLSKELPHTPYPQNQVHLSHLSHLLHLSEFVSGWVISEFSKFSPPNTLIISSSLRIVELIFSNS